MDINSKISLRDNKMNNSRYDGGVTAGRIFSTMMIVNPLIDSAVVNANAKNFGDTFYGALQTGIYNNYTFMGGNGLMGDSMIDKIPIIGKRIDAWKNGKKSNFSKLFGDKITFNYLTKSGQESMGINEASVKARGFSNPDHMIETGYGFSRNYGSFFKKLHLNGFEKTVFNGNTAEDIIKYGDKDQITGLFKQFLTQENGINFEPIMRRAKKFGVNIDFVVPGSDMAKITASQLDNAAGELSEALYKKFFTKTTFEKIMSNDFVKLATGNAVSGVASLGLGIGGAIVGGLSLTHGETAIQNVANAMAYENVTGADVFSQESVISNHSHASLSMSNDQDINFVLSGSNMAHRYRREMDPVDIDETLSRKENFLLY